MGVPFCGPKLSICCTLLSIWGVIMLAALGVFFKIRAVALNGDIPIKMDKWAAMNYSYDYVIELYDQNSLNCFIACGIYVATFFISFILYKVNVKMDAKQDAN